MIAHPIETARRSRLFDKIVVTTDSEEIATLCAGLAVDVVKRPSPFAEDHIGTQVVARVTLDDLAVLGKRFETACVLYPCAPLLLPGDLLDAFWILSQTAEVDYVVAVGADPLRDAGAMYFGRAEAFVQGAPLISPYTRLLRLPDARCCDVNDETDWKRCEEMYAAVQKERA